MQEMNNTHYEHPGHNLSLTSHRILHLICDLEHSAGKEQREISEETLILIDLHFLDFARVICPILAFLIILVLSTSTDPTEVNNIVLSSGIEAKNT